MQIDIANKDATGRNYLTWAPQRATLGHPGVAGANPITATVSNSDPTKGGQLEFATQRQGPFLSTVNLTLRRVPTRPAARPTGCGSGGCHRPRCAAGRSPPGPPPSRRRPWG